MIPLIRVASLAFLIGMLGVLTGPAAAQDDASERVADLSVRIEAATALRDKGKFEQAAEAFAAIVEDAPGSDVARFNLAYCTHMAGQYERAIELHKTAAEFPRVRAVSLYNLACALAMTGRRDEALAALERAVDAGFSEAETARTDSDLDAIREDPRFDAALARIGRSLDKALSFWIGAWDCYSAASGSLVGHNVLEARVAGRVIHEHWTPVGDGPAGESWNYLDPASGSWKQNWVDVRGDVVEFEGRRKEGGMLFEAVRPRPGAKPELVRMFVRPTEGGRVRQTGSRSFDGGDTWEPRYDIVYVPKGEAYEAGGQK